jgi:EAL domain-containing protein (putative c-di-GMP-specific phosphodiesterase class I)
MSRDDSGCAPSDVAELVSSLRIGAEYQPIVEVRTGRVVAHEALARFAGTGRGPLSPAPIFAQLHAAPSLLFRVECEVKKLQLEHAPRGPLHVNVDPDSFAAGEGGGENALLDVLACGRAGTVVEVIENMTRSDAKLGREMIRRLHARGLSVALDDVGAPDSLLSLEAFFEADVVKFDRSLLAVAQASKRRPLLEALVPLARRLGACTILEGVETAEQLSLARELDLDLVQGFLFRDRLVSVLP